jgi:hypothetical protein
MRCLGSYTIFSWNHNLVWIQKHSRLVIAFCSLCKPATILSSCYTLLNYCRKVVNVIYHINTMILLLAEAFDHQKVVLENEDASELLMGEQ